MAKKQRSIIEEKLDILRANYLLTTDATLRSKLLQEIGDLEKQLLEEPPMNTLKNVINNAEVQAGGDINLGDVTHIYQYGPQENQIDLPAPFNWKKWIAIITSIGLLLSVVVYNWNTRINNQPEKIDAFPVILITKDTIRFENEKPTDFTSIGGDLPQERRVKVTALSEYATKLLKKELEKEVSWRLSNKGNSEIEIDVTYSGRLVQVRDQYYRYSGGYVQIKVNDELCCCEDILPIDLKDSKQGNLIHILEKQLSQRVDEMLKEHLNHVIEKIKTCAY